MTRMFTGNIAIDSTDSWDTHKTISGMTASALVAREHVVAFAWWTEVISTSTGSAFADSSTEKLAASLDETLYRGIPRLWVERCVLEVSILPRADPVRCRFRRSPPRRLVLKQFFWHGAAGRYEIKPNSKKSS